MRFSVLLLPIFLTGCLPDEKKVITPAPVQCFEIYDTKGGVGISTIALNKCTGDSWILARGDFERTAKNEPAFVYRWYNISGGEGEAILVLPGSKR